MASRTKLARIAVFVLCGIGLALCVALEITHWKLFHTTNAAHYCSLGSTFDCRSVALSRWSIAFGLPLPFWGAAGFIAIATAAQQRSPFLFPLVAVGTLVSLALFLESALHVGTLCILCEAVHALFLLLAPLAWIAVPPTRTAWSNVTRLPSTRRIALAGFVAIALPYVALPRYWTAARWLHDGVTLPHGIDAQGHAWIGATAPTLQFEEWIDYRCPHCAVASRRSAALVSGDPTRVRLIRRHQPGVECRPVAKAQLCLHLRAALCAGQQGKFWEMDAWLFAHAVGKGSFDLEPAMRAVDLSPETFTACLDDPATFEAAAAEYRAARDLGVEATPAYRVGEQLVRPGEFWRSSAIRAADR